MADTYSRVLRTAVERIASVAISGLYLGVAATAVATNNATDRAQPSTVAGAELVARSVFSDADATVICTAATALVATLTVVIALPTHTNPAPSTRDTDDASMQFWLTWLARLTQVFAALAVAAAATRLLSALTLALFLMAMALGAAALSAAAMERADTIRAGLTSQLATARNNALRERLMGITLDATPSPHRLRLAWALLTLVPGVTSALMCRLVLEVRIYAVRPVGLERITGADLMQGLAALAVLAIIPTPFSLLVAQCWAQRRPVATAGLTLLLIGVPSWAGCMTAGHVEGGWAVLTFLAYPGIWAATIGGWVWLSARRNRGPGRAVWWSLHQRLRAAGDVPAIRP